MIRRISGKPGATTTSHLKINSTIIEQPTEIANTIASTISHNSSSDHYTDRFQRYKSHQEKRKIHLATDNQEPYYLPFNMAELHAAIHKAHDSATGPDNIHYQMLKNLPQLALDTLLQGFNDTWISGSFPSVWSEATIIPIPKPGDRKSVV